MRHHVADLHSGKQWSLSHVQVGKGAHVPKDHADIARNCGDEAAFWWMCDNAHTPGAFKEATNGIDPSMATEKVSPFSSTRSALKAAHHATIKSLFAR